MDMRRSQIIPTNIEYTAENLELVRKFLQSTEQYIGDEIDNNSEFTASFAIF